MQSYATTDRLRNGDLAQIAEMLKSQRARAVDFVAPANALTASGGQLVIAGTEPVITDDGVTTADGRYQMTAGADAQLAGVLDIPVAYMRRMFREAPDLWDLNVNGWLGGFHPAEADPWAPEIRHGDPRKFLIRLLSDGDGGGMVRAVLSDRYRTIDNLDVLLAVLAGVQESGTEIAVDGADLTETRMSVRIAAPGVAVLAPQLLAGYRSPFTAGAERAGDPVPGSAWNLDAGRRAAAAHDAGYPAGQEPVIFAGFQVSNSDTGGGAFSIVPRLVVQVCKNGLTITVDALRHVHLGSKLDEGVIRWSDDTNAKNLALVTARARDAVTTFLDAGYVARAVAALEEQAGVPVKDAAKTVEQVTKRFAFTEAQGKSILDHFIIGGQLTAGGIMQAVSSVAQTVEDGDQAAALEAAAVPAMAYAASV